MGNYIWHSLIIEDFDYEAKINALEYELTILRNQNQILERKYESLRQEKENLRNQNNDIQRSYLNAVEQSLTMFDTNIALRGEIEFLKSYA